MTPHPSPERVKPSDGLEPCPHCGGPAKLATPGFTNSKVVCADNYCCEAMSVSVWNKRPALANVEATIAELREALARETEECAKVADYAAERWKDAPVGVVPSATVAASITCATKIAANIRSRTAPATAEGPKP